MLAVLYHVIVAAVGVGLVGVSYIQCVLSTGRVVQALAVLIDAGASMHDHLLQGPSVAVEYVAMMYLGAVVAVPFRRGRR